MFSLVYPLCIFLPFKPKNSYKKDKNAKKSKKNLFKLQKYICKKKQKIIFQKKCKQKRRWGVHKKECESEYRFKSAPPGGGGKSSGQN